LHQASAKHKAESKQTEAANKSISLILLLPHDMPIYFQERGKLSESWRCRQSSEIQPGTMVRITSLVPYRRPSPFAGEISASSSYF
jgi:hypothetical protein